MATIIGKIIGLAFVLGIVGAPLFGSVYYGRDLYLALTDSIYKEAEVVDCHSIRSSGGGNVKYSHAPVAKTLDGELINGSFGFKDIESCKEMFGSTVGVYVSNKDPKFSQINTFFQLWLMPLVFFTITLALYFAMYKGYKKKRFEASKFHRE